MDVYRKECAAVRLFLLFMEELCPDRRDDHPWKTVPSFSDSQAVFSRRVYHDGPGIGSVELGIH